MTTLATRTLNVVSSPTKEIAKKAKSLAAAGRSIVSLSLGEPDFDTPLHIREAAKAAIDQGMTHYTEVAGTRQLRDAICARLADEIGCHFTADEVTVGCGAKQVLFNAFLATLGPGDEVVVPAPYWVSYPDMVRLADGTPVIANSSRDDGFKLRPGALARAITPKTKWLLLNSPNNPSGGVYSVEELSALLEVLKDNPHVLLMSDEIYRDIVYGGQAAASPLAVEPGLKDRMLVVNGVSKAYAMTGWRVGYGAGPAELISAINRIQSQSTSHTCSIAQAAATAALRGSKDCVEAFVTTLRKRRDLVLSRIEAMPELHAAVPEGAFYVFPSCEPLLGRRTREGRKIEDDVTLSDYLLGEAGVAVVPGAAFGMPGHIRLSYAASEDVLSEGCERLARACATLQ